MTRIVQSDNCWLWTGAVSVQGYGIFMSNQMAHRYSYELFRETIPEGLVIDHLCRNKKCVNPDHLEPVTNKINILRGIAPSANNARKTHCKQGHEFTPDNTIIRGENRQCRECHKLSCKQSYQKRKLLQ